MWLFILIVKMEPRYKSVKDVVVQMSDIGKDSYTFKQRAHKKIDTACTREKDAQVKYVLWQLLDFFN